MFVGTVATFGTTVITQLDEELNVPSGEDRFVRGLVGREGLRGAWGRTEWANPGPNVEGELSHGVFQQEEDGIEEVSVRFVAEIEILDDGREPG